jgi:uncharacterized phage-associated protein
MTYSSAQIDKIGNLLVYITDKLGATSKTKLLKLVYIIEEEYIKKAGVSLTPLSFTHLPMGPVSTFINKQISKNRAPLNQYINVEPVGNQCWVKPKIQFTDDEFSEFDIEIIDDVLDKFGHLNAVDLSNYTHREGSIWKKMQDQFKGPPPAGQNTFDMSQLLEDEDVNPMLRDSALEHKSFVNYITGKE